jgi:glyoxylase-like metal-dependent hydrolase (beta-lactamase superfamily II)
VDDATSQPPVQRDDRNAWTEPGTEDLGGGLYRIPLPLPGDALKAVNVYAIASDDGVYLVDAGMAITGAKEQLTSELARIGYGLGDIRNFFITHIHQDHYTLAVELRTTLRGEVTLGEGERANLEAIREVAAGKRAPGFIEILHSTGSGDFGRKLREVLAAHRDQIPEFRLTWADPDRWLTDGTVLDLRSRKLRTIHTPGHTAGHVVFHDEANAALFAGDHVLPHITPSIGFQPSASRSALIDYLNSLRLLLTMPDSRLLPAHGPVRESTHARVRELLTHHDERLAQTQDAASGGPVTAFQAAGSIPWTRRKRKFSDLDMMSQVLAIGETAAHLEVLVARGQLTRHTTEEGVDIYSAPPPAP